MKLIARVRATLLALLKKFEYRAVGTPLCAGRVRSLLLSSPGLHRRQGGPISPDIALSRLVCHDGAKNPMQGTHHDKSGKRRRYD